MLHTDGIVEVNDRAGGWFDAGTLTALVAEHRHQTPEGLIAEVVGAAREFVGAVDFEDDVTLVVAKRLETDLRLPGSPSVG